MGLFDQIVGAIENPNQQGNVGELGNIVNTVEQLSSSTGTDSSTMQSAFGIVGNYVRSALQQKSDTEGHQATQDLVSQFAGTSPNPDAVNSIFSAGMQQEVANVLQERTGLDARLVEQFLPMAVPLILNLLHTGANTQEGGNPILSTFLSANHDSGFNIASAIQMASQFIKR